ncbi:hypothetical protein ABEB36_006528 [Hypothenemus hampei]|uniref:Ubiquinone biosynthesis monooxygenase COQ6, mitochondrial n=1 Tax=Hypothenemus hampei TaxID=57062 RepID=A0ABD1EQU5_HYPHA
MLNNQILNKKGVCLLWKIKGKFHFQRFLSQNIDRHYDIIIAGGGMVGTTLACTLGKNSILKNKKILLLEAGKEKPWTLPEKYNNRVVSVNPGSQKLLSSINAWNFIEKNRVATVKQLQVWEALSDASITFEQPKNNEPISYIVENDLILAAVAEQAQSCPNLEIQYEAKVKNYQLPDFNADITQLKMENGQNFSCNLLLGCDGVNSTVRKCMHANYISWNYGQMGVVATLQLDQQPGFKNDVAWQRFLPNGPVALLPLTDELSSLVWSTTIQQAKELLELPEERFVEQLNKAIGGTFKKSSLVSQAINSFDNLLRALNCPSTNQATAPTICGMETNSRAAFPLGFGHSSQYIGKGVVLVGDAAHRIHPLAGQGVNLGFGDVNCLNEVLTKAVYSGGGLNDLSYLKEYESERQKHNLPMMIAVEGLHRLTTTTLAPIVLLRGLGLQFSNALVPLKKYLISQASI